MLFDETARTSLELSRKEFGHRTVKEGIQLWKKQQEEKKVRKLTEQREMREMLEKYWPFGSAKDMQPRGLRNLRQEGLFPNKDYLNAKRFVGTLELGRPGGGAPLVGDGGKKVTGTREDPLLRFQFGSHDLRRCVDNSLRYKTDRLAQQEYKKDLDKMVQEKKKMEETQKREEREFYQKQGCSNEKKEEIKKENGKVHKGAIKLRKLDPIFHPCKNVYVGSKSKKLSALPEGKENGIELVPLLAKQRNFPQKIHLDTTDVTNEKKIEFSSLWNRQGSAYLKELTQQMSLKQEKLKEMKAKENEIVQRHFATWSGFWGKPGHGAPRSAIKKQRLDRLLYPQMIPIGVH